MYIRRFRHDPTRFGRSQKLVHGGGGIINVLHKYIYVTCAYIKRLNLLQKQNIPFFVYSVHGAIILLHPVYIYMNLRW